MSNVLTAMIRATNYLPRIADRFGQAVEIPSGDEQR